MYQPYSTEVESGPKEIKHMNYKICGKIAHFYRLAFNIMLEIQKTQSPAAPEDDEDSNEQPNKQTNKKRQKTHTHTHNRISPLINTSFLTLSE